MRNGRTQLLVVVTALLSVSCSGHDDDYFPYRMKGLNAWVYDSATETEFLAGYTEAGYTSRQEGLASCASLASSAAAARQLKDWSYVCCTVTSKSQCATKVR
jgi:hypothetical protein